MAQISPATEENALDNAVAVLRAGQLLAIPTETVYGLAADATNGQAVAKIYAAKRRPSFNPLIIHCADMEMVARFAHVSQRAALLANAFWPGPLTLVMPVKPEGGLSDLVLAGLNTVAIRIPRGITRDIIQKLGSPLAAPSANLSGRVSTTTAQHVSAQLGNKVDLILDNGPCSLGLESTILSLIDDGLTLLRPGGLPLEELEKFLGSSIKQAPVNAEIAAPGMLASHYAPSGSLRLNALEVEGEDGALNFGPSKLEATHTLSLSRDGNLEEAAANLFAHLTAFDKLGVKNIAAAPVPLRGLGLAINDRLTRAAAPKE